MTLENTPEDLASEIAEAQNILPEETSPSSAASASLRAQIAEIEAALPGLTDIAATAGARSYGSPDDTGLRQAADQAMAALQAAQQELDRLRIALPAASAAEADAAEAIATAKRQREKDGLVRGLDRIFARWSAETDAQEVDQAKLTDEDAALVEAERVWQDATLRVEVRRERIASRQNRIGDLADQHLDLEQRIAAFPVTVAEIQAAEAARLAAEAAELAAAQRRFDEATAAELARLADAEMVEVGTSQWQLSRSGPFGQEIPVLASSPYQFTVLRRDLEAFRDEQTRLASWAADRQQAAARSAASVDQFNAERRVAGQAAYQEYLANQADNAALRKAHGGA